MGKDQDLLHAVKTEDLLTAQRLLQRPRPGKTSQYPLALSDPHTGHTHWHAHAHAHTRRPNACFTTMSGQWRGVCLMYVCIPQVGTNPM